MPALWCRVKAHALREIITAKDTVLVMGHRIPDADSFGATVGIYRIAQTLERKAHIVLNDAPASIQPLLELFRNNPDYEEDMIIDNQRAIEIAGGNVVLVVVDVNKPSITECPDLLRFCKSVVVLDHHRAGNETIENATLSYVEPYASFLHLLTLAAIVGHALRSLDYSLVTATSQSQIDGVTGKLIVLRIGQTIQPYAHADGHCHLIANIYCLNLFQQFKAVLLQLRYSLFAAMYLFDETALHIALQEVDDQSLAVGMVYLDNYDEALESVEEVRRSLLIALIDRKVNKYISSLDGISKKLEKDKYLIILRKKAIAQLQENRFELLEEVKTVNIGILLKRTTYSLSS